MRPVVTQNTDGSWTLLEDLTYIWRGHTIVAPAGFTCDLGSVPKVFRSIIDKGDLRLAGPIFHDLIYRASGIVQGHKFTRAEADLLFRIVMQARGVKWLRRWTAWAAVRLFGWPAWR